MVTVSLSHSNHSLPLLVTREEGRERGREGGEEGGEMMIGGLMVTVSLSLSLATRCLHSLSRSTKLLRTSIVDVEVWRPVLEMLSLRDEECLQVASGVACNLMLAFSPSREVKHWCFIFYLCKAVLNN